MTYCLGMALESGLVLMADTRTNAGVDDFSSVRKLHLLAEGPDRQIYAATYGDPPDPPAVAAVLDALSEAGTLRATG